MITTLIWMIQPRWVQTILWLLGYRHEDIVFWDLHHLCPCGDE